MIFCNDICSFIFGWKSRKIKIWHSPNLQTQILFLHFLQSPLHMLGLKKLEIHYSQFWQLNLCLSAHSMALKWYVVEFFSHQIVGNNDLMVKSKSNSDFEWHQQNMCLLDEKVPQWTVTDFFLVFCQYYICMSLKRIQCHVRWKTRT